MIQRPQRLPPQPPRQRRHHRLQWWSAAIRVATKSTTVTNTGLTFAQRTVHGPKPTVNVTANSANVRIILRLKNKIISSFVVFPTQYLLVY